MDNNITNDGIRMNNSGIRMNKDGVRNTDTVIEHNNQMQVISVQDNNTGLIVLNLLTVRQNTLRSLITKLYDDLTDVPEGQLRITHVKGHPQYFFRKDPENPNWTYIRKKDSSLAYDLAQKDYLLRLLRAANTELRHLENTINNYHPDALANAYLSLSPARREIVRPYIQPKEELIRNWLAYRYVPKPFSETDPEIFTEKGERVRSKSEKMIADKLALMGIPYRYEAPLSLDRYTTIYPDFTLLHADAGREIYLEHNGMMDDSGYSVKAVRRINQYIRNGIYPGDGLLLTFETSNISLDMRIVEKMILHRFSLP